MQDAVIGIDPGAHAAAAILRLDNAPTLVYSLTHRFDTVAGAKVTATALVRRLLEEAGTRGLCIISAALEEQFVRLNPRAALTLARSAGRWQEACAVHNIAVTLVEPSAWQSKEFGTILRRAVGKHRAVQRCLGLWQATLDEDEADAALIGRWHGIQILTARRQQLALNLQRVRGR
jgi:Holliday junction resolvasome RuvABC endonuclease subunit